MAVVFDATAETISASGAVTVDLTTLTVGTGSNRALIALICWEGNATGVTLTWDQGGSNQAMTLITGASVSASGGAAQIFGLVNPVSGNKTLRA